MKFSTIVIAPIALLAMAGIGPAASAAVVIAPNAYAAQPGYEYTTGIFGNGSTSNVFYQTAFAASQFTAMPIGARITGIGFRMATNLPTISSDTAYSDFTIRIGQPSNGVNGLTTNETGNMGADTILARTGALTIAGGSLVSGFAVNPFYTIAFTTPYTYQGGDLLVSTRYTTATSDVPFIGVDAIDAVGVVNTLAGNDPAFLHTHTYNAPVIQFTFESPAAVPEPATWLMMIGGFGATGLALRRRPALRARQA